MVKKDLRDLFVLTKRNTKLYFKEKSAFFTSLITPMILLVLFITFLRSTYINSLQTIIPTMFEIEEGLLNSFAASWLMSSVIGVSCITVAFCVNMIMVNDKITKARQDMLITPVKQNVVSLSYFFANAISTLIVNYACMGLGFAYIAFVGWYFTVADIIAIVLVVLLCSLFGCSLACVVEYFVSSSGAASAILTLVSSMYGFICGAYMPLSQFSEGIRNVISCLPGTYSIGLLRNYYLNGVLNKMGETLPEPLITAIKDGFDGNMYFFGDQVSIGVMFAIIGGATALLIATYMCFVFIKRKGKK